MLGKTVGSVQTMFDIPQDTWDRHLDSIAALRGSPENSGRTFLSLKSATSNPSKVIAVVDESLKKGGFSIESDIFAILMQNRDMTVFPKKIEDCLRQSFHNAGGAAVSQEIIENSLLSLKIIVEDTQ
jgi:hypothetical protein